MAVKIVTSLHEAYSSKARCNADTVTKFCWAVPSPLVGGPLLAPLAVAPLKHTVLHECFFIGPICYYRISTTPNVNINLWQNRLKQSKKLIKIRQQKKNRTRTELKMKLRMTAFTIATKTPHEWLSCCMLHCISTTVQPRTLSFSA
jgi:hypothetical protein